MAGQMNHRGTILPQDSALETDFNDMGVPESLSQTEIDEYLSNDERPAAERLTRLLEYRDELLARQTADFADNDSSALLHEVEGAIRQLRGLIDERDSEDEDFLGFDTATDLDPSDHSETLSPDGDERAEREEHELESIEDDFENGETPNSERRTH